MILRYHKVISLKMVEPNTILINNLPTYPYQVIISASTKEISLSHFSPKQLCKQAGKQ